MKLNKKVPPEALAAIPQIDNPGELADRVASHLSVKIAEKQQLLEIPHVVKRLEKVYALMEGEISVESELDTTLAEVLAAQPRLMHAVPGGPAVVDDAMAKQQLG